MSLQIDSSILSVVLVVGVLGLGLLSENIKVAAIGALALLVLMVAIKAVYVEPPVILAMIVLALIALYGDDLMALTGNFSKFSGDVINSKKNSKKNSKENLIFKAAVEAYARQVASAGHVFTVDYDYSTKLIEPQGLQLRKKRWFILPDERNVIILGGADTIDQVIINQHDPLPAEWQVGSLVEKRRMHVRVRIKDPETGEERDDVWVRVKAYVATIELKDVPGAVSNVTWEGDIRKLDMLDLGEDIEFVITDKGVVIQVGSVQLEKRIGTKSFMPSWRITPVPGGD